MARVVEKVAPDYGENLYWEKVVTKELRGAFRLMEVSQMLGRPAPVPSILIDKQLVFEMTPGEEELRAYLDQLLAARK
jgi:hypothetical protein